MAIAGIPNPGVCAYPPGPARRRYARRAVERDSIGADLGDSTQASVLNLSEGGMQVKSWPPPVFPKGGLISLTLPGGTAIQANCEVVWTDASGVAGLRFLAFSDNSKTKLGKWLSERLAEPPAVAEIPLTAVAPASPAGVLPPELTRTIGWSVEADEAGLEEVVRKMMAMTAAEGAAIALPGDEAIVCRATAGNAPQLGTKLQAGAGLSSRCLRSGEPVLCRDSETDPTVNAEACRALRLRAALLVPVKCDGRTEGVLEVFSSKPDVFDLGDVVALQRLAETVAGYLPRAEEVIETAASLSVVSTEAAVAAPPAAGPTEVTVSVPSEPEVVAAPSEVNEERAVAARPAIGWPNAVFRLIGDPHYQPWKRVVYWSAIALRKTVSLATWTVPLSYLVYFLVGPVIRPGAVQNTAVFGYISGIVEPGMALAENFFSFRAVIHGWNLMFLVVAGITLVGRAVMLKPIYFVLKKIEDLSRPKKRYAYVPYLPHRTEFR